MDELENKCKSGDYVVYPEKPLVPKPVDDSFLIRGRKFTRKEIIETGQAFNKRQKYLPLILGIIFICVGIVGPLALLLTNLETMKTNVGFYVGVGVFALLLIVPGIISLASFGKFVPVDPFSKGIQLIEKDMATEEAILKLFSKDKVTRDVASMSGIDFEKYIESMLRSYSIYVTRTKDTGDQGADLIVYNNGFKTVIQCKRYSGNVGNGAIQEIFAAKAFYSADRAIVVTNSEYTDSAILLAKKCDVVLIDKHNINRFLNYPSLYL